MVLAQSVDVKNTLPEEILYGYNGCIIGVTTNENNIPIQEVNNLLALMNIP